MKTFYITKHRWLIIPLELIVIVVLYFMAVSVPTTIGLILLITIFFVLSIVISTICFSYKLLIDENGLIKEKFFGKTQRQLYVKSIEAVTKHYTAFDLVYLLLFTRPNMGPDLSPSYRFSGDFSFKHPFPFFNIDFKSVEYLISINPNIKIDSYFYDRLSSKTRKEQNLKLSWTDKVGRVLWYFFVTILIIIGGIIVVGLGAYSIDKIF